MRCKLISCEVLFREMCDACSRSPHQLDVEFLPKGLHDLGGKAMAVRLQEAVDRTPDAIYDAVFPATDIRKYDDDDGHYLYDENDALSRALPKAHVLRNRSGSGRELRRGSSP